MALWEQDASEADTRPRRLGSLLPVLPLSAARCRHLAHVRDAQGMPLPPAQAEAEGREANGAAAPQSASAARPSPTGVAPAAARSEATAAEAALEPSLEDLHLQAPALRPVGCWWAGCAPSSPTVPLARAHRCLAPCLMFAEL